MEKQPDGVLCRRDGFDLYYMSVRREKTSRQLALVFLFCLINASPLERIDKLYITSSLFYAISINVRVN